MISHAHLETIFEFTPMKHESSAAIRRLINTYTENTMALTGLGLKIDQCDLIWVHVLAKKLDPETRRQWELSCAGSDVPKIKQLKKFLEERSRALEATKDLQLPSIHRKNHQGSSDQSGNSKKDDKLSDPDFDKPKEIDIILGCDVYNDIVGCGKIKLTDKLYARDTLFGWMISGRTPGPPTTFFKSFYVSIDDSLRKFWELEEIPDFKKTTTEEDRCESHFKETTILQNGRFTVQLPFKPKSQLGDSLAQAKLRFNYLERRLEQNPELKDRYTAFIDEFLDMGHMEYIPPGEIEKPVDSVYYLPHHCVFKEDSTTTKLRVVFDGSATTSTGQSLNDTLMVGPTVQDDLYSIIMRFRFYPIGLSADIAKMYRQVALEDKSKDFHRILWRSNKSDEIKHLKMTRVTYGIASSAFHSTRCLNEVAD
ncbi:uncharacterized protein LOC134848836 [Symsagittifera roscoffensis]|uniref:uncharacterized protein LOC134848836 n=1 Tax=Symsagittifera roscoffensis TaxID=84072 RepID=UPI00307BFE58